MLNSIQTLNILLYVPHGRRACNLCCWNAWREFRLKTHVADGLHPFIYVHKEQTRPDRAVHVSQTYLSCPPTAPPSGKNGREGQGQRTDAVRRRGVCEKQQENDEDGCIKNKQEKRIIGYYRSNETRIKPTSMNYTHKIIYIYMPNLIIIIIIVIRVRVCVCFLSDVHLNRPRVVLLHS